MKIKLLSIFFIFGSIFFLSTASMLNPSNPPTGRTGAPGETTCMASGCHTGGVFVGTVTLSGVPDTARFGQVYPITVTNTSNAIRAGFQLTCLDSLNAKCGTVAAANGVNIGTGSSRQYARQSSPRNLSAGSTSWTFNWTAPASAVGNKAHFYFVSLCSDNNGQKTGDNVLINSKQISLTATSSSTEPLQASAIKVYPTPFSDVLHIDLSNAAQGTFYLYDNNGQLLLEKELTASNELNIPNFPAGAYSVKVQTKEGFAVRRVIKL